MIKPSSERVSDLEHLSGRVYTAIDQTVSGEPRSRAMVRLGVNLVGEELHQGASLEEAGTSLIAMVQEQLLRGGLSISEQPYANFSRYQQYAKSLPRAPFMRSGALDSLANRYADVTRATIDSNGERETDGRHAIHLMALAVPYAMEYYPRLSPAIIAVDALTHDFPEAFAGDTPTLGITDKAYAAKVLREQQAMKQLEAQLGKRHPELFNVIQSYEDQDHDEAHYIRRFDKEDPFFTHRLNRGQQLIAFYGLKTADQFIAMTSSTTERIAAYPGSYPLLAEDRAEFIKRLAQDTDWPAA